jgi:conserved hypothetical protein, DprA/Smf-related, family 2
VSTPASERGPTDSPGEPILKAYKNSRFMMGENARELRILAEYLEPRARLAEQKIHRGIVFFGSARIGPGATPDYYAQAADLAERLARWTVSRHPPGKRYHLCSGGGPGLMEAMHRGGARVDRSLNVGLNISLPHEQHLNHYVDEHHAFEFHYFFMRKFWFTNLAQAVVAFPGGFGTLDELFEVLTLVQTGKMQPRPIVLYGSQFWKRVLNLPALLEAGTIGQEDLEMLEFADDPAEAERLVCEGLESAVEPVA